MTDNGQRDHLLMRAAYIFYDITFMCMDVFLLYTLHLEYGNRACANLAMADQGKLGQDLVGPSVKHKADTVELLVMLVAAEKLVI